MALDSVVTEGFPKVRDVGLDDVAGPLGWLGPDLVDQRLGGYELVRTKNQVGEDGALLGAAEGTPSPLTCTSRGPRIRNSVMA